MHNVEQKNSAVRPGEGWALVTTGTTYGEEEKGTPKLRCKTCSPLPGWHKIEGINESCMQNSIPNLKRHSSAEVLASAQLNGDTHKPRNISKNPNYTLIGSPGVCIQMIFGTYTYASQQFKQAVIPRLFECPVLRKRESLSCGDDT